jgi:uncharacterized protein YndB with AHSA1/START domain
MADNTVTQDLMIERTFDAPPALVWKAWSDPKHLMRWWGPEHFTAPVAKIDFRVGGAYLLCMESPDGQRYYSTGAYTEIIPYERIAYTDTFADADGNRVSPTYYGMSADFPEETAVIVTFEALADDKTRMTLTNIGMPAGQDREMALLGWSSSLDKLAATL